MRCPVSTSRQLILVEALLLRVPARDRAVRSNNTVPAFFAYRPLRRQPAWRFHPATPHLETRETDLRSRGCLQAANIDGYP